MARINWKSRAELDQEELAQAEEALRAERNKLLQDSDWTQLADAPITAVEATEWARYRRELRELPENTTNPRKPDWPVPPTNPSRR